MQVAGILYSFKAEWSMVAAAAASVGGILRGMATSARNLITALSNVGSAPVALSFQTIASASLGLIANFALLAAAAVAVAAAVSVAIGVVAVRAAADFQQGMTRLVTGAGDVTDNMTKMGQSILGISIGTGVITSELLPAMYQIISAGQRGAQAEDTLRVAAQGAIIEQAKVVDVTKALTTAMTDYGTKQYNATQFMNGYIKAVSLGKITLQDLSTAMGPILPISAQLGIKFSDVAAAMSVMTNSGIGAERAATSLRFLMQSMENPTKKASDAMKAMGLNSVDVGNEMKKSLPQALEMIYKAALKAGPEGSVPFNRAMIDMIGGQRSLTAALALTGTHFKAFSSDASQIVGAMNNGKNAVNGYKEAQSNLNNMAGQGVAALHALAIIIGVQLLPFVTALMGKVIPIITGFAQWANQSQFVTKALSAIAPYAALIGQGFMMVLPMIIQLWQAFVVVVQDVMKWMAANKGVMDAVKLVVLALGIAIGVILLAALIIIIAAFVLIGLAILAVVFIVKAFMDVIHAAIAIAPQLGNAWNVAIKWLTDRWNNLVSAAKDVWGRIGQAINTATTAVVNWVKNLWNTVISWIVGQWNTLANAARDVWGRTGAAIQGAVNSIITWVKNAWKTTVDAIVGFFQWLYNHNYYWKDMVDAIRTAVSSVVSWLQSTWQTIVTFITNQWNTLATAATDVWGRTGQAINTATTAVVTFIQNIWTTVTAWLKVQWDTLATAAVDVWNRTKAAITTAMGTIGNVIHTAWDAIVTFLSGIWSKIVAAVQTAWANITGKITSGVATAKTPITGFGSWLGTFFGNLASTALTWGSNLIRGIGNGISSMIGWLGGIAQNAASTIAHFLGFHSPTKEGPGKELDTWGPGMMHGFAQGIIRGMPEVQRAVASVMNPIATLMRTPIQVNASGSLGVRPGSSSNSPATYIIQINGKDLVKALGPGLAQDMRLTIGGR